MLQFSISRGYTVYSVLGPKYELQKLVLQFAFMPNYVVLSSFCVDALNNCYIVEKIVLYCFHPWNTFSDNVVGITLFITALSSIFFDIQLLLLLSCLKHFIYKELYLTFSIFTVTCRL